MRSTWRRLRTSSLWLKLPLPKKNALSVTTPMQSRHLKPEQREHETLERYVRNEIEFDDYREMRKLVAADKLVINAELERLRIIEEPTTVSPQEIALNFKQNWDRVSNTGRRAFLKQFVEKIIIESKKVEDSPFRAVSIKDIVWRID